MTIYGHKGPFSQIFIFAAKKLTKSLYSQINDAKCIQLVLLGSTGVFHVEYEAKFAEIWIENDFCR